MANRQLVRKIDPHVRSRFDDQQWPVNVALVVLGGFLIGAILAYQEFDGSGWWASPWLSISLVVLLICSTMATFYYMGNRFVKRTMQLAVILCAIVHLVFLILSAENTIFSRMFTEQVAQTELRPKHEQVRQNTYHPIQSSENVRQPDFMQPVDTERPEPEPKDIERDVPEDNQSPEQVQPRPINEPEPEVQREVVNERAENAASTPRSSDTMSKLSRSESNVKVPKQVSVEVNQRATAKQNTSEKLTTNSNSAQRVKTTQQSVNQLKSKPSESEQQQLASNVQRVQRSDSPKTDISAKQTVQRSNNNARSVPKTASIPVPMKQAVSEQTEPTELTPKNTVARQENSTSPEQVQQNQPTAPDTPQEVTQQVEVRRESPTDRQVSLATNQTPSNIQRQRVTDRSATADPQPVNVQPRPMAVASNNPLNAQPNTTARQQSNNENANPAVQQRNAANNNSAPQSLSAADIQRQSDAANPSNNAPRDVGSLARTNQSNNRIAAMTPNVPNVNAQSLGSNSPAQNQQPTPNVAQAGRQQSNSANNQNAVNAANAAGQSAARGVANNDAGAQSSLEQRQVGRAAGGGQPQLNANNAQGSPSRTNNSRSSEALAGVNSQIRVVSPTGTPGQSSSQQISNVAANVERERTGNEAAGGDVSQVTSSDPNSGGATEIAQANVERSVANNSNAGGVPDISSSAGPDGGANTGENNQRRQFAKASNPIGGTQITVPGMEQPNRATAGAPSETEVAADGSSPQRQGADGDTGLPNVPTNVQGEEVGDESVVGNAVARAEKADAAPGAFTPGGGTEAPKRNLTGAAPLALDTSAMIKVKGAPASGGAENGVPVEAQGENVDRVAGGANAPAEVGAVDGEAGEVDADADTGLADAGVGERQESSNDESGPSLVVASNAGGPMRQSPGAGNVGLPLNAKIQLPGSGATSDSESEEEGDAGAYVVGPTARASSDPASVKVNAPDGSGGLGEVAANDAGITDRRASDDSVNIQLKPSRFERVKLAGAPGISTKVVISSESFNGRTNKDGGGNGPAGPQTEEAIERGLAFLARCQRNDGSWTLQEFAGPDGSPSLESDSAATALSVLAFQGAGYNHLKYKYKDQLRSAVEFLMTVQSEEGDYYLTQGGATNQVVRLYTHGIATLAMCEAYGMTQDPAIKDSVQRAIDFIVKSQHATNGGWRYVPGREGDTSVTGWMMMALESGRRANLNVPSETMDMIKTWVGHARDPEAGHLYRYNPFAPDNIRQGSGRTSSKTMTSVGLLMQLYLGGKKADDASVNGARYLLDNLPSSEITRNGSMRDTYYWYYATQFMFHMGGEYWKKWNDQLHPMLIQTQVQEGDLTGSWDPRLPVPDRWGPHAGRIYITTMNLLSLEVTYRHLPLYSDQGDDEADSE